MTAPDNSLAALKPCPFCGGEAKIVNDNSPSSPSGSEYGYRGHDAHRVRCAVCWAEGKPVTKKFFIDLFDHKVSDYDRNPALRSECNEKYRAYELTVDEEAVKAWNTRAIAIPAGSVGDEALALEMFDRGSVRNKQNMYQFRDEDIDLIRAALTAPEPESVDLRTIKNNLTVGVNIDFEGIKIKEEKYRINVPQWSRGWNDCLDYLSTRYNISKKE